MSTRQCISCYGPSIFPHQMDVCPEENAPDQESVAIFEKFQHIIRELADTVKVNGETISQTF